MAEVPGRIESQIALDLAPLIKRSASREDLCKALGELLDRYTNRGQRALSRKRYYEAKRNVEKAYRIFDLEAAMCPRRRK